MGSVVEFIRDQEPPLVMETQAILRLAGEVQGGKPLAKAIEDLDRAEQDALHWLFDFYTRDEA